MQISLHMYMLSEFVTFNHAQNLASKTCYTIRNFIATREDSRPEFQDSIERLHLTSQAVKHPQHSPLYSISLIRLQGKKVVSSTVILETQAGWHLPSTTVSTVAVAQLPCRLN